MESIPSKTETVPLLEGGLNLIDVINEISHEISKDKDSNARIKKYIEEIKSKISDSRTYYDDEELLAMIKKHPYFKNPCKYPIRLISIMKYLKKKGIDVLEKDMDLRVDRIITQIPSVQRVEFGLYRVEV